jgi:hypothetical protein
MIAFTDPAEAGKLICGPAWLSPREVVGGVCTCPGCMAPAAEGDACAPDEPPW